MRDSLFITQAQGDCPEIQKRAIKLRLLWIGMGILILFITVIFLFTQILTRQEQENKIRNVRSNGAHLVSLISLYPMKDFETDKRDFFLRTLIEYTSSEGMLYLFIHDHSGKAIVSLIPEDVSSIIPDDIKMKSLYTMGLAEQTFKYGTSGDIIYEFAKPIFEKGEKTGTVRLGIKQHHVPILSLQRISLLSMIPFSLFAALLLGYHGINTALKPLKNFHENFKRTNVDLSPNVNINTKNGRIIPLIDALEQSLNQIEDKLDQIKTINIELTSKLGVTTFEKKQIVKILDTIGFGIIITDMQNNVNYANEYMFILLNKTREEVIRRPLEEILNHEEILSLISRQEILEQNRATNFKEILLPDLMPGETYQVSSTYALDSEMTPIGKIMFIKNITSEKISEEAKQNFIAHIAHELLTPLTNIKSYSEMLMDGEIQEAEVQREFYNTINEETNRLSLLVQNLLSISKIEMGKLTINKGLVRTDWFVNGCLTPIEASAQNKNITIEKRLPEIFPTLIADKDILKAAIINLLGNAIKYTPENGKVTFSISEEDNKVLFEVIDTGYGIAREDIPHIFDKFYRSSNPCITRQAGSGLGLAITSDIVHLHSGTIEVESQLGEGSHFTIKIPKEEYQIGTG